MARPNKKGLDYFSLDTDIFSDRKIRRIMKAFGPTSITVLICLLCTIYSENGYYILRDEELLFDISDLVGVSEGCIHDVISKAINVGLFDIDMFKKFNILTSERIQNNYFKGVERRNSISIVKEYLLVNVDNNPVNVNINSVNDSRSTQRESKENNSKLKERENSLSKDESSPASFENIIIPESETSLLEQKYGTKAVKKIKSELDAYNKAHNKTCENYLGTLELWIVRAGYEVTDISKREKALEEQRIAEEAEKIRLDQEWQKKYQNLPLEEKARLDSITQ